MKDEFLVGTVDLMTGEKDPRNLMVVFSILKVVMIEWDISNHAEVSSLVISPSSIQLTFEVAI
jgi:DNA repair/transcription protein MET18/MMS19